MPRIIKSKKKISLLIIINNWFCYQHHSKSNHHTNIGDVKNDQSIKQGI